ncbi:hypothetical protein NZNM25_05010 [Nitrosopumilus zosterae]|uniref:Uncharacterized protein n=1 Tax=Nitrosopumilus zosterae TaxID=718286 RepID=A0A2S2KPV0_9ARCH|nr:hypothetical protein [Nitrosopumilus zosterae]BDQ31505.1 hypothetical protein NZOSNM25_001625 [Nitrosopumilus zosterae]GBH33710.1 hypothetical protein NZNM25_05010 [Nitrosopumilus zosterae]
MITEDAGLVLAIFILAVGFIATLIGVANLFDSEPNPLIFVGGISALIIGGILVKFST